MSLHLPLSGLCVACMCMRICENVGTVSQYVCVCVSAHVLEHVLPAFYTRTHTHTHPHTHLKAWCCSKLEGHPFSFTVLALRLQMSAPCCVPDPGCEPGKTRPGGAGSPLQGDREAAPMQMRMITDT